MFRSVMRCMLGGVVAAVAAGCSGGGAALSTLPASAPAAQTVLPATTAATTTAAAATGATATRKANATITFSGLTENFSGDAIGGAAAGWTVVSGNWSVCQVSAVNGYCQPTTARALSLIGPATWTDYTVSASVVDPNVSFGAVALVGRASSPTAYYQLALGPQTGGSTPYWYIGKLVGSRYTILASGPLSAPDTNPNYGLRLTFAGSSITAAVAFDGGTTYKTLGTANDSDIPSGQIGLSTSGTAAGKFSNVAVTLAGPALGSESAVSSAAFVDTIGLNALFDPAAYNPSVRSLIANLGVRHYRAAASSMVAGTPYISTLADLYNSYGITFDVLANLYMPAAQVVNALQLLPAGSVNSVEGPNEADCSSQGIYYDPNFATDLPPYMQSLYAAVKSTPATSQLTVIGPSLCLPTSYAAIGNISSSVDAGNMHDYFAGFNPGTPGWGSTGYSFAPALRYGNIAWNIAMAGQATGTKPVIATETGYCTAPIHGCVPLDIQAKYTPRLYLEQYRAKVPRTFVFKLVSSDTSSGLGTLGIVGYSGVPNPAYTALAGMISVLADGGRTSSPVNYNWALTGQTAGVDHVLMHKADGTLILPIWIEGQSYDPNANGGLGAELSVPPQTVMVNLPQTTGTGTLWTCNPATGAWKSASISMANGAFALTLTDSVSILVFKPSS